MSEGIAQNDVEGVLSYMYHLENLPAFSDVEELRWKTLIGNDGERIGTIESIERNEDTERVEFMQVGRGGFLGFGAERFLVPVTAIVNVDEKHVSIDRPLRNLDGVPEYDYERAHDPDYCAGIRAWWCAPVTVPETP
jgi:sporulation protein YlmC with PRC-barrel domain